MESPKKFLPIFDALLIGGLGCGVLGLCILAGVFVFIWQNPPGRGVNPTPIDSSVSPVVPTTFPDLPTPTLSPTIIPSLIPSPIPGS